MAIGGLISSRNFGSFIGSGKACQKEKAISHIRRERLGIAVVRNVQGNMFTQKLSAYIYGPMFHVTSNSNEKVSKFIVNSHLRKRSSGRCECHLSSEHSLVSCFQPRAENNRIGTCNGKGQQSEHVRANRIHAHYKSEDFDITEANVDALRSSEGTSEAALVEGNAEETYPWWEQFPKRWVIVPMILAYSPLSLVVLV